MRQAKSTSKLDRPEQLYFNRHHHTCDENVNFTLKSSSSEDENSPTTEMNCKKVIDKPTLVSILLKTNTMNTPSPKDSIQFNSSY